MKAIILENHGDYNNFKFENDYPNPILDKSGYKLSDKARNQANDNELNCNEVIVKILYSSVNRIDLTLRKGYQSDNSNQISPFVFPHILGSDVIGEIVEINYSDDFNFVEKDEDNEHNYKIGDRIIALPKFSIGDKNYTIGINYQGSYSEYIKLPMSALVKIPNIANHKQNESIENIELEKYSGLPTAGLIAFNLLSEYQSQIENENIENENIENENNENEPTKNLLIIGGEGGVGTYIIQLAKYFGFNVITTAGNQKNINNLHELKADEVFNHYDLDFKDMIFKKYNHKIDLIIDYLGGDNFPFYVEIIKNNGKIKTIGAIENKFTNIDLQKLYSKNITIQGQSYGTKKHLQKLVKLTAENKIKTVVNSIFTLEEIPEIHKLMESKSYFGKNIIKY